MLRAKIIPFDYFHSAIIFPGYAVIAIRVGNF